MATRRFEPVIENFPISSKDPVLPLYEKVQLELLKELDIAFKAKLVSSYSLTLVKRGYNKETAVPTIILTTNALVDFKTEIPEELEMFYKINIVARY